MNSLEEAIEEIYKEKSETYQRLFTIADTHGLKTQLTKLSEECGELIQALSKFSLNNTSENLDNLCEEMADVEIILFQIEYLLKIGYKIKLWKDFKINKTFESLGSKE